MTGYGKAVASYGHKKIHVEIKTLNSKSADITTRITSLYREKEMELRKTLAKALDRGKIDFALWTEQDADAPVATINATVVESYYHQIRDIAASADIPEPQDWFSTIFRLPDVTSNNATEELTDDEWQVVSEAVSKALDDVVAYRKQEGEALEKKFSEKIDNITRLLNGIEPYEKERVPKIKAQIISALEQIPEADYNQNRLEQELIYYIEKLDINEEKQRLSNHLKYFRETMNGPLPNGKKLGFIAQEMGREINTMGSKSNNAQMQNIVVMMKDELEQIKEQVLNAL